MAMAKFLMTADAKTALTAKDVIDGSGNYKMKVKVQVGKRLCQPHKDDLVGTEDPRATKFLEGYKPPPLKVGGSYWLDPTMLIFDRNDANPDTPDFVIETDGTPC